MALSSRERELCDKEEQDLAKLQKILEESAEEQED